ncbi:MAG: CapA family protein [Chloroflexota bacterium]
MRVALRAILIVTLSVAITGAAALTACRRATPTPMPVAQTLTRIAAVTATHPVEQVMTINATPSPSAPRPTATFTATPLPTLPPQSIGLALPAWLLASQGDFFERLDAAYPDLYLLPVDGSTDARALLEQGQARLAILTDAGQQDSQLLRQSPFVLASHLGAPPLALSLAQIQALFAGQAQPARRVVVLGDGAIERDLLGLDALRSDATTAADWPAVREALLVDPQAVALLPWEYVTPQLRLHPVDGLTFGPGALEAGYPLVQRWRLSGDGAGQPDLWQALAEGLHADFQPPVSLIAVGDIMLARNVATAIAQNGADHPFAATATWLRAADLAFGNLETPLANTGQLATSGIAFLGEPSAADGLLNAGFDILALANNHIGDYGAEALAQTIQNLTQRGIVAVGAGADATAARAAQIVEVRGLKIAFLARSGIPYGAPAATADTPGAAWLDAEQTLADVRAAARQADVVVLSLHWGSEYTYAVTDEQRAFVQQASAAGADLILGHHSHNAQALDLGHNRLAAYSLGNFIFDQTWSVESSQGLALRLLLDAGGVRAVEPLAVHVVEGQARLLPWDEGKSLLAEVLALTSGLPAGEPEPSPDAPWTLDAGGRVTGLAAADLDGDGHPELVAATGSLEQPGTVHALRGGQHVWQFKAPARINTVRAADLDGDGRDELLLATGALDQPSWVIALDESGRQLWRYTVEARVQDVAAADLDGDGRRNQVLAAEWGSFDDTIYALDADGALRWVYETSGTPNRLLPIDLDGDGATEIVIGGDALYALDRAGGLRWKQKQAGSAYIIDLTAAELDGDGRPELIAGVRYPAAALAVYDAGGGLRWSQTLSTSVTTVAAADLNGDGRSEILAGTVDGAVVAVDGAGSGVWQVQAPGAINALAAVDLNGDGAVEVVAAAGDDLTPGGVAILAADGTPILWRADPAAVTALHIAPAADGWSEIVAGSGSGWVYPVEWRGALETMAHPTPLPTATRPPLPTPTPTSGVVIPSGVFRPTRASYRIEVNLDYWEHILQAQEQLTFTNTLGITLPNLLLAVPANRSAGTFALASLTVDGAPVGYELQDTSLWVTLPAALSPGGAVTLEMTFSIRPPTMRVGSIFGGGSVGYSENAFNAGNWHPILAPYRADRGWLETPWHAVGDPYVSDMGDYVVTVRTAPEVTVVGPGVMEGWPDEGRWRFTMPAARTFAFAASHRYQSAVETAHGVTVASFYYPEHQVTGQLALANAAAAVRLFDDLFGPYPYTDLRIAETDFSGGQEFSGFMLFGSGAHQDYLDAGGGPRTILFTLIPHETAHQWWYGVVGNDQARQPWLDEALAKYSEQLFYERLYPEHADWRWAWMGMAGRQPASLEVTIYDYVNEHTYKDRTYLTGALFLAQLRQALGDDAFFAFIQAHLRQGANRIVTTDEFLALLAQYADSAAIEPIVSVYFGP